MAAVQRLRGQPAHSPKVGPPPSGARGASASGESMKKPLLATRWARKLIELRALLLVAMPVGAAAGAAVAGLEGVCNSLLWHHLGAMAMPGRALWPVVGLVVSGYILHRLKARSVGMLNEVVVHYHAHPERLSAKDDALKLGACVATVGLGASAGLGGPSQWLGARIALYFHRLLSRWRPVRSIPAQQMLLIGAAGGVSAIFRAPLAGTLLALETPFTKDIDGTALLPASVSALTAHLVHGVLVDRLPMLPFPSNVAERPLAIAGALVIGIAAGLLSRRFQRVLIWIRLETGHVHWSYRALGGGAVTSATGLAAWAWFGDSWTFQGGIPLSHALFAGQFVGTAALALLALKLVSVWATFGTSGVAGLLVVTLTVGSLVGATLQPLLPGLSVPAACAIGVCAYLAANYNAPLTAIALAAEWGGTELLSLAWVAVLVAAWIGEGLANTPAKVGRRHGRRSTTIEHH